MYNSSLTSWTHPPTPKSARHVRYREHSSLLMVARLRIYGCMVRRILVPGPMASSNHRTRAMTTTLEACSVYANSSLCSTQDMALTTKLGSLDTEVEQRRLRERACALKIDSVNFVIGRRLVLTNAILRAPTPGSVEPSYNPLRSLYGLPGRFRSSSSSWALFSGV